MSKAADAFRTISEVAEDLDVHKHVLRFWENRFPQIKPMKRGGGRRYYRPADMELLRGIRHLLHNEGYTIKGVQKILREQGVEVVKACWQPGHSLQPEVATDKGARTAGAKKPVAAAAGSGRKPAAAANSQAKAIAAVIRELQACRSLLSESSAKRRATVGRKPAAKVRSA